MSEKRENFLFMEKDETENFFEMERKIIFKQCGQTTNLNMGYV